MSVAALPLLKEKDDTNSTEQSSPICTLLLTSRQANFITSLLPSRYSIQCQKSMKSKFKMKSCKAPKTKRGVSRTKSTGVSTKKQNDRLSMPPIDTKSNSDRCSQKVKETPGQDVSSLQQSLLKVSGREDLLETTICKFVSAVLKNWETDVVFGELLDKVKERAKKGAYGDFAQFKNDIDEIIQTKCFGKKGRDNSVKFIQEIFSDYSQIYQQIQINPKQLSQLRLDKKSGSTQIGCKSRSKAMKRGLKEIASKVSSNHHAINGKKYKKKQNETVEEKLFAVTEVSESETKQQGPISYQRVAHINKLLSRLHRCDQQTLLSSLSSENNGCLIKDLRISEAKVFVNKIKELLVKSGIEEQGEVVMESSFEVQSDYSN